MAKRMRRRQAALAARARWRGSAARTVEDQPARAAAFQAAKVNRPARKRLARKRRKASRRRKR
jgi:hypothetical protein